MSKFQLQYQEFLKIRPSKLQDKSKAPCQTEYRKKIGGGKKNKNQPGS